MADMTKDVGEMTLDECCSEIGWLGAALGGDGISPEPTLDAIAVCLPKDFKLTLLRQGNDGWHTTGTRHYSLGGGLRTSHADTEILARARLAVLCLRAMKENNTNA